MTPKFIDRGPDQNGPMADRLAVELNIPDDRESPDIPFRRFEFGTCHGLYRVLPRWTELLAVMNDKPHNGDFVKLLWHFERQARPFLVVDCTERLGKFLLRRGYQPIGKRHFLFLPS